MISRSSTNKIFKLLLAVFGLAENSQAQTIMKGFILGHGGLTPIQGFFDANSGEKLNCNVNIDIDYFVISNEEGKPVASVDPSICQTNPGGYLSVDFDGLSLPAGSYELLAYSQQRNVNRSESNDQPIANPKCFGQLGSGRMAKTFGLGLSKIGLVALTATNFLGPSRLQNSIPDGRCLLARILAKLL
jgi:hypothetical protein